MKNWDYTGKEAITEELPEVPRVSGMEPFIVRRFPLPARRAVYLANGVIGLRLPAVPFLGADVAVSGSVGRSVSDGMESAAPAPFPVAADMQLGHCRLSERPDLVTIEEQSLDMSFGELSTRLVFRTPEAEVLVDVLTFVPRSLPTVICQEITVQPNRDCELMLESRLDPAGLPGRCRERRMPDSKADAVLWWETRDALSSVGAAFEARLSGTSDFTTRQNDWGNESDLCLRIFRVKARAGQRVMMRQLGSLVPSIMHDEPHWQALRMVSYGWCQGFDRLRHDNRCAWIELWKARPVVETADAKVQRVLDSAFFYVHSSVHPCTPWSVPPFGLSRTEGFYNGHIFIDHECFIFPPLLLTAPDAARATLDYRTRRLHVARMNAACTGCRGAMFPWQSGMSGCEVTRPHATDCVMEFSTPAIAQAFLQYVHAAGDELFLRESAWPVLRGAADWAATRVTKTSRGYEIRNLTADEQFSNTHNDPDVNRGFVKLLRDAVELARKLGLPPNPLWSEVADNILVLTDEGALLRETAQRAKKPPLTRETLREVMGDIVGSPISDVTWVTTALKLGDREQARQIWEECVAAHWLSDFGTFREWGEMWSFGDLEMDCFLTWPAVLLKQALIDFPRMEISDRPVEQWCRESVVLPAGWERISANRIWVRGRPARLDMRHGASQAVLQA